MSLTQREENENQKPQKLPIHEIGSKYCSVIILKNITENGENWTDWKMWTEYKNICATKGETKLIFPLS